MKIYLDSGNIEEIKAAASLGILDGVTTNPSLIAKEGKIDFRKTIKQITKILSKYKMNFTVSAEVTNIKTAKDMIEQARELSKIDKHIVVKIPLTEEGIKACTVLSSEDIRCNVTLCFSANQALIAAKAGAYFVSPFIGRVNDEGHDGFQLIKDIKKIYDNYNFETKILSASIRSCGDVLECAKIGSDLITVPYSVFSKLYYNPLTDIGLDKFEKDWQNYQKELDNENKE